MELPSKPKMLLRGTFRACPLCATRGLFRWGLQMVRDCPTCGLRFERIEGHFIGAIGMNTIVTFVLMFAILVGSLAIAYPEFPVVPLLAINVTAAIVLPLVLYGTSKTLWTAIDLSMRPLEPHEADLSRIKP